MCEKEGGRLLVPLVFAAVFSVLTGLVYLVDCAGPVPVVWFHEFPEGVALFFCGWLSCAAADVFADGFGGRRWVFRAGFFVFLPASLAVAFAIGVLQYGFEAVLFSLSAFFSLAACEFAGFLFGATRKEG
jgi:hypothetical protein